MPQPAMKVVINPTWKCQLHCDYCLGGETLILKADLSAIPIRDLRVGDIIVGLKRVQRQHLSCRILIPSIVEGISRSIQPVYRIALEDGREVRCSANHRWLTERGWRHTAVPCRNHGAGPFLTGNNSIRIVGQPGMTSFPPSDEYRRGYLSGMIRGDALLKTFGPYKRANGQNSTDYHFRLCLIDEDALQRTKDYLESFGITTTRFDFSDSMGGIRTHKQKSFEAIQRLIAWQDTREYQRGFVAGLFDAEGSVSNFVVRISNTDPNLLAVAEESLREQNFDCTYDVDKPNGLKALRIRGGRSEYIRFVQWCDSAIQRKRSICGSGLHGHSRIREIKRLPKHDELYDIQTSTGNFIANGMVSHNCWMHVLGFKPGDERPWREWLRFVCWLPQGSIVDFSGGEPLLYEGIMELLQGMAEHDVRWAMTTNLVNGDMVRKLEDVKLRNCVALNVSAHADGPKDFYRRAARLRDAGYRVTVNLVGHPAARDVEDWCGPVSIIPYQEWKEGLALDGKARMCDAGKNHLACSPEGNVYRCAVHMQVGAQPLATIRTPPLMYRLKEPVPCETGCSSCYTHEPGAWLVEMREVQE